MIKALLIFTVLTASVYAQDSSNNTTPLIPTGISETCKAFLEALNAYQSLTACTNSLIELTKAYGPGETTPSQSAAVSTLNSFCSESATSSCPESLIGGKLIEFYPACANELTTSPVAGVLTIYEVLYAIQPMKNAVCAKDDDGSFCATKAKGSVTRRSTVERRADAVTPNIAAYHASNLPFIFLTPELDNAALCTPCTRKILSAWFNFESRVPYVPGIPNSPLLSSQTPLHTGVTTKCGEGFLNAAVGAAGSLGNSLTGSAVRTSGNDLQGPIAALMSILSLAAASML